MESRIIVVGSIKPDRLIQDNYLVYSEGGGMSNHKSKRL